MKDMRMGIEGMHCEGCASRIQGLLEKEPGVRKVRVFFGEKEAQVRFNPHATDGSRITEIVRGAGFDVTAAE